MTFGIFCKKKTLLQQGFRCMAQIHFNNNKLKYLYATFCEVVSWIAEDNIKTGFTKIVRE
jgi:hypothetical protein